MFDCAVKILVQIKEMISTMTQNDKFIKRDEILFQFMKFCLIGFSNTVLSYLINIIALFIIYPMKIKYDYIVANLISFMLSVLWAFYWNDKYVFANNVKERSILFRLIKTYIAYGFTGIVLCNALSYVWIEVWGISKLIAPLINLIVSVPLNFIINKYWAFK